MSALSRHIYIALVATVLLVSCSKDEAEVIPRSKLAKIYAEMLMTDQWITSTSGVRKIADTSLVYEPILEKYGYSTVDYCKTVEVYMDDPERFSRVLRTSAEILDKQLTELRAELKKQEMAEAKRKRLEKLRYRSDFKPEEYFPYMFDEPFVHYYDSVSFSPDSILYVYRLIDVERTDTIYEGVRMKVAADTLVTCDSLAAADTIVEKVVEAPVVGKPERLKRLKDKNPRRTARRGVDKMNITK
ncbi:MAG: DUF4296 domain-containing protein [Bacteroidales bacterium]|nr:DUF4296 domain-containing protein [Bacteroidales bacterium]